MKRILIAALMLVLLACGNVFAAKYGDTVYNSVNIHVDRGRDTKASYAIYTGSSQHDIIPINTKLKIGKWRKGFTLTVADTGEEVFYEFHKGRMKMSVSEYLDKITSPSKTMLDLPPLDMECIEEGIVKPGMTKEGVFHSLGYPPTHKTPNMDKNKWIYWMNRFRTRAITFDSDGIVVKVNPEFE